MRCLLCKSAMENKCTNYIADLGNRIIVIHNVPTQVCSQCGEKSYSFDVSVRIQELTKSLTLLKLYNKKTLVLVIVNISFSSSSIFST